MEYKYAQNDNYEDFASGRVLYHVGGEPTFPVRLALEMYERCLQYSDKKRDISLYDCCCGGAYMLTILGLLKSNTISKLYGSEIDLKSIKLAEDNLGLLTKSGVKKRRSELDALYKKYGKVSHMEALQSIDRIEKLLTKEIKTFVFNRNVLEVCDFPIASFSNEECATLYDELIHRIENICLSLYWDFDKGSLNEWLIELAVEDLSSNINPKIMKKIITSINYLKEPKNIDHDLYHKVAATIITAYIITDSTYFSEAFDYSLISHFYSHSNQNSIFSLQNMLNGKDFASYHPYVNYYIFQVLVMKLYQYKLKEIEENNELIYQKDNSVLMDIPAYIVVSRDSQFDIYEVD
ncbi:MAG: hypothetical protein K0R92_662 [Lachnospiraceae bacterium]|jgi:hypothetical protein|nr:hypothetical protein [Lachnospiraceae bacterium]